MKQIEAVQLYNAFSSKAFTWKGLNPETVAKHVQVLIELKKLADSVADSEKTAREALIPKEGTFADLIAKAQQGELEKGSLEEKEYRTLDQDFAKKYTEALKPTYEAEAKVKAKYTEKMFTDIVKANAEALTGILPMLMFELVETKKK